MNRRPISFFLMGLAFLAISSLFASALAEDKPKQKAGYLGVQIRSEKDDRVVVTAVINNSPAEKAGLKSGDQIVSIDDVKPANLAAAVSVIRSLKPGKKVKLQVKRDGKEKTIEAVPGTLD